MEDREKIENDIDILLQYLNESLEEQGATIKGSIFSFNQEKKLPQKYNWSYDYMVKLVKKCLSRKFLERTCLDCDIDRLSLTAEGQARALSAMLGKKRHYELEATQMNITTLNVNGLTQIGNNNTQNFKDCFNNIFEQIENSQASPEEKQEAKSLIQKVMDNTLLNSIINGASCGIAGVMATHI